MAIPLDISSEWLTIVNPNAGLKRAAKDWKNIAYLLKRNDIRHNAVFTTHRMHAVLITREAISKGYRKFLVVGGDGTLNEVVNGMFLQQEVPQDQFTLAMIPIGTGNDWCRMYQIPFEYKGAVEVLMQEKTRVQDIGKVVYHVDGHPETRYLINMAGMGYDALVAEKTNKMKDKGRGGPMVYLYNLFSSLLFYKYTLTKMQVDQAEYTYKVFSMNVGICQYNGAGMKQLPAAIPDDGLLDVTVIRRIGRLAVMRNVKKLYDGSFIRMPQVVTHTGKSVNIESTPPISLEVDGESLGHSPFQFEILSSAIRVVVA